MKKNQKLLTNSLALTKKDYIDYIKLLLTGGVLELEITDETISLLIDSALTELCRYIDQTKLITVPYAKCIDLTDFKHSSIIHVFRSEGLVGDATASLSESVVDPMYALQWMAFSSGGFTYSLQNYVMNYAAYSTLLQMRNTTSTDMIFREDKSANKLYINCNYDLPTAVTIEYIPIYTQVEEITSDYWIDILKRLALALTKVTLGRVRTRFTQSNALWVLDGETLLAEGNDELKELREVLRTNSLYFMPVD